MTHRLQLDLVWLRDANRLVDAGSFFLCVHVFDDHCYCTCGGETEEDHKTVREMANKTTIIDSGKARRVLGWTPKHAPLLEQVDILYAAWKAKFLPPAAATCASAASAAAGGSAPAVGPSSSGTMPSAAANANSIK